MERESRWHKRPLDKHELEEIRRHNLLVNVKPYLSFRLLATNRLNIGNSVVSLLKHLWNLLGDEVEGNVRLEWRLVVSYVCG